MTWVMRYQAQSVIVFHPVVVTSYSYDSAFLFLGSTTYCRCFEKKQYTDNIRSGWWLPNSYDNFISSFLIGWLQEMFKGGMYVNKLTFNIQFLFYVYFFQGGNNIHAEGTGYIANAMKENTSITTVCSCISLMLSEW